MNTLSSLAKYILQCVASSTPSFKSSDPDSQLTSPPSCSSSLLHWSINGYPGKPGEGKQW